MSRPVRTIVLVFGLVLVLSLGGCESSQTTGDGGGDTGASEANKYADLTVGPPGELADLTGAPAGEAADYGGWTVGVSAAQMVDPEIMPAELGPLKVFAIAVAYENKTDQTIHCGPSDWELQDANGPVSSQETTPLARYFMSIEDLTSRDVTPGAIVRAAVYFVNPGDPTKVVYKPPKSLGAVPEATWLVDPNIPR